MTNLSRTVLLATAALMLMSPSLHATERKPLPLFFVQALAGQSVGSTGLALTNRWIIVLVQPDCAPCDKLLEAIPIQPTNLPGKIVVIVTGVDASGAAAYKARFPGLASARWFADRFRNSSQISQLPAAPVMFGLRQTQIEWSLAGIAPDIGTVHRAIVSWLN